MAWDIVDTFSACNSHLDLSGAWTVTTSGSGVMSVESGQPGPFGYGQTLYCRCGTSSGESNIIHTFGATRSSGIVRCWYYNRTAGSTTSNANYFRIDNGGINTCLTVAWVSGGGFVVRRGNTGGTQLAITSGSYSTGTWYYLEFKYLFSDTIGTIELRTYQADGTHIETITAGPGDTIASGTDTQATRVIFGSRGASTTSNGCYWWGVASEDASGDFRGPMKAYILNPTSDLVSDFTPLSGGDNYAMVDDDSPCDGDTTYNSSSTSGHEDEFGLDDLPEEPNEIWVARAVVTAKRTTAGTLDVNMKHGGSSANNGPHTLTAAYQTFGYMRETPPSGGTWDENKINATRVGYDLASGDATISAALLEVFGSLQLAPPPIAKATQAAWWN